MFQLIYLNIYNIALHLIQLTARNNREDFGMSLQGN